jgi:hypothetical protein
LHIGEGTFDETEYYIKALMAETDPDDENPKAVILFFGLLGRLAK